MLKFRKAEKNDKDSLFPLLNSTPEGAVAFYVLCTSPDSIPDFFFLGENEDGEIKSIIFDTGDEYFLVYGDEFPSFFSRCEKMIMKFTGSTCEKGNAEILGGKEILELYKLLSGTRTISFDDERRYVLRLRAVNTGLAAVFGIKKNGRLVSSASVSSMNGKYAVIADVFTEEKQRNKGLARDCLKAAAGYALEKGKIPVLLCNEDMCAYYEKAGFGIYGKM